MMPAAHKKKPFLRFKDDNGEEYPDWEEKKLGEAINSYRLGGNYQNGDKPNDTPLIKMGNLARGKISIEKVQYIEDGEKIDKEDLIQFGDLFFNTRNTLELVGKVSVWRNELPKAFYNSNLMRIDFDNNFFMNYYLNSFECIKGLRRLATGTTSVAAIYTRDLLLLKLNIPSLPEQKKIADFLSSVDQKIQLLEKKKEQLELYKKGLMQQLFTQQIRFKDDNGEEYPDWEEKRFGDLVKINQGLQIPISDRYTEEIEGSFFYITNEFLKENSEKRYFILNPKKSVMCDVSDILMTRTGNTGMIVTNIKGVFHNNFFKITYPDSIYKEFLFYFLNLVTTQNTIKRLAGTSTIPDLNHSDFYSICINFPSFPEQKKIADFLSSVDKKIEITSTQIDKTKAFKKGLLQQMFV